jgi:hypothetical protein
LSARESKSNSSSDERVDVRKDTYKDADGGRRKCDYLRVRLGGEAKHGKFVTKGRRRLEDEIVAAAGVQLVPVPTDQHHAWFVSEHRPTNAECRQQLDALTRSQNTGTKEAALLKMKKALKRVQQAGKEWAQMPVPASPKDYAHLIEGGAASEEWKSRIGGGERPPGPFRTGGLLGRNGRFDLSAMRHWLERSKPCTHVAVGLLGAGESEALQELPLEGPDSVFDFIEGMRPVGDTGIETPRWIQKLLDGHLQCAVDFWE